jgi:chromosome segregation ATPase
LRFGHKTPEEVLQELQALRKERDDLNEQLIARPSHQTLEKLRQLEADKEAYELQREAELVEMASLKSQLRRSSVNVIELETLKDQKSALESSRELTKAALDELQKDVKEIIERDKAQSSFPQCSQMDNNEGLQNTPALVEKIPDLAVFAKELQQRMAYDPNTKKELYYELSDIQCFLGGLAMTHLHLLQGISGIGKTSLPLAFARAISAGSTLVEVQAGWRDRQDLIGYYNTFEKAI